MTELTKETAQNLFAHWIKQRPGLDFRNYWSGDYKSSVSSYRTELRSITKDLHRARKALDSSFGKYTPFDLELLLEACRAFSGRLELEQVGDEWRLSYCTGQYWPTEYRLAAAVVLERYIELLDRKYYQN